MSAHAAAYGQLPRTLQPASPEDASNLPFNPDHGVQVRLQSVADNQYLAVAFKRSWRCWIIGTRDRHSEPDCAPASGAPVSDAAGDSSQTRLPLQAVDSTRSH